MSYSTGADVGTGLSMTWNSTAFPMELLGLSGGEETSIIDVSHMGSTTNRAKIAGDLIDNGSIDIELHLAVDQLSTIRAGSTGTVAITLPWGATTKQITGGMVVQSRNYTVPFEDKMTCGYTLTWTGAVTYPTS